MNQEQLCPCGSGADFAQCCGPYLDGSRMPPTAEALMRSRYVAYTRMDDKYLLDTWLPATRPDDENPSDDGDGTVWTGLEVRRIEAGGPNDEQGIVEFVAFCDIAGQPAQLHETSTFQRVDGRWLYVDGEGPSPVRRAEPKVGRNDPCPCGSGKKYKKCCGG